MIDIIKFKCEKDPKYFGFSAFFLPKDINVVEANEDKIINRMKNKKVALLTPPRKISYGAIKLISLGKSATLLFNLGEIGKLDVKEKARMCVLLEECLKNCLYLGAGYAFCSMAEKEKEIRNFNEWEAFLKIVGLNKGQIRYGFERIEEYIKD